MKGLQVKELTNDELRANLASLKETLYKLRFKHATGQLTNTNELVICKRDIARVMTAIRAREIAGTYTVTKTEKKVKTKKGLRS